MSGSIPSRTSGSAGAVGGGVPEPVAESCPLCGAPLDPEQEWCLHCGAAARTRLASTPKWRPPLVALAVVIVLSLGVLAAALVKLAGNSSPATAPTTTVTRQASVTSPGTATAPPAPSATTPPTPGASAAAPVALAPVTPLTSSIVTLNGTVNPQGVRTTYEFHYGASASYGSCAPCTPVALGAGTSAVAVSARVAGLAPGTTYHYNLTASKAGHAVHTADATFTTPVHSPSGATSTTPGKTRTSGPAP